MGVWAQVGGPTEGVTGHTEGWGTSHSQALAGWFTGLAIMFCP